MFRRNTYYEYLRFIDKKKIVEKIDLNIALEPTEYIVDGGYSKGTIDSNGIVEGNIVSIYPYEENNKILAEIPEQSFIVTCNPNNNYTFSTWKYNSGNNLISNGATVSFTNSYLKLFKNDQIFASPHLTYVHVTAQNNNLIIKFNKRIVELTNIKLSSSQSNTTIYYIDDIFTAFLS